MAVYLSTNVYFWVAAIILAIVLSILLTSKERKCKSNLEDQNTIKTPLSIKLFGFATGLAFVSIFLADIFLIVTDDSSPAINSLLYILGFFNFAFWVCWMICTIFSYRFIVYSKSFSKAAIILLLPFLPVFLETIICLLTHASKLGFKSILICVIFYTLYIAGLIIVKKTRQATNTLPTSNT